MIHWFSFDPATGAGLGKGVSQLSLDQLAASDPSRGFIEITAAQHLSIHRAERFFVESGVLTPKLNLSLTASASPAPADGSHEIMISWPLASPALNVVVNLTSVGSHAGSIELTSAGPARFSVYVMDVRHYSDPVVVAFE